MFMGSFQTKLDILIFCTYIAYHGTWINNWKHMIRHICTIFLYIPTTYLNPKLTYLNNATHYVAVLEVIKTKFSVAPHLIRFARTAFYALKALRLITSVACRISQTSDVSVLEFFSVPCLNNHFQHWSDKKTVDTR